MVRAIYALKIWIFMHQFDSQSPTSDRHPNASSGNQLLRIYLFLVTIYIKCSSGNDLRFLMDLSSYHNQKVSKLALTLSQEISGVTLFGLNLLDPSVGKDHKRGIVHALNMQTLFE